MTKSFKRLERVLKLEAHQGYKNKAVVGGVRNLVTYWVTQAREEVEDEADKALVEQIAETLMDYDRLAGPEKREEVIEGLLEKLGDRQETAPAKAPEKAPERPSHASRQPSPPPVQPDTPPQQAKDGTPAARQSSPSRRSTGRTERATHSSRSRAWLTVEASVPDPEALEQPVTVLRGVGPKMAERLARLDIHTIYDLLYTLPRRHDDYTLMKPINRLQYGEQVTVIGTVWEMRARRTRSGEMSQAVVSDGTGRVQVTWFNQPWVAQQLPAGAQVVIRGKVDQYLGRPVFNSPQWEPLPLEPLKTQRIVPVYPLTEGLKAHKMREIARQAVESFSEKVVDPLPEDILRRQRLNRLPKALQGVHFPETQEALHEGRRRLIFDDLFLLQLGMFGQRREWQKNPGIPLLVNLTVLERFLLSLPFTLTDAQRRVIKEIAYDLGRDTPMSRLLQGDVGSGKTVVAATAMLAAVRDDAQAAMMAPTEILAEQHYQGLSALMAGEDVRLALLTGSTPASDRANILEGLANGDINIVIGTHALIQAPVKFRRLALAVVDEQHRFGVDQRKALREKGPQGQDGKPISPHLLVMSATPIPRSLALSIYGDLDLSIIDELPPGRQEIRTRWLRPSERERSYAFVRGQVEEGRQAFIICPLVEESDKIEAVAAVEEHARLQNEVFPDLKLGLMHGRLSAAEKDEVMRAFYENKLNILVSTSVIEVGIDVPNASVMLIEGANRFGLAQLHQFRGRVGRGQYQSYCLLISDTGSQDAEQRLQAMEQTNDGFVLAEKDLELRGPGEFFGRQQSGLPEIEMAALLNVKALERARVEANRLFESDPDLEKPENAVLRQRVRRFWEDAGDVS